MADPKRLKFGRQTTCSRKCSYDLRALVISKSTTLPCAVCETPVTKCFGTSQGVGKAGVPFCFPACHYKGRSLGLVHRIVTTPYSIPQEVRDRFSASQTKRNLWVLPWLKCGKRIFTTILLVLSKMHWDCRICYTGPNRSIRDLLQDLEAIALDQSKRLHHHPNTSSMSDLVETSSLAGCT